MKAPIKFSKSLAGLALGLLSAYFVSSALAGAYRDSEILNAALSLAIPPLALFFLYRGSEKRFVFCVAALLLSAILFDVSPSFGLPRGLSLVLVIIASMAVPVIVDLCFIDMGRQIHVGHIARLAQVAFLVALVPFAGWKLFSAHETILKEDQKLVGELAKNIRGRGNSLVVDKLDAKTSKRALQRLAIRTQDKVYPLSDADVESVRETRTVRKVTNTGGTEATEITREQEERMRLILQLQGTALPDDVVVVSQRGPLTIYEAKVAINKDGS
ncbi:MAG: hypothetical protein ACREQQ_16865 [Candidatus Binatia bacterium]